MAKRTTAAKPRFDETARPADGPSAQDFAEMRRQLATLTKNYNDLKAATGGVELLPPEEVPIYEIGEGGYYSPDDVLYPAGVQIEDITGSIIPNEAMIPLNAAAERRMSAYLKSLPKMGAANNHELFLEAAMSVAHTFDASGRNPIEAKLEFNKMVMDQMTHLQMKQRGMLPDNTPRLPVKAPRSGPVPMMSNTRIREGDVYDRGQLVDPLGLNRGAAARGPVHTRVRKAPLSAAQKNAPPMGTVHNETIGR
jgi:hypothetical protein